MRMFPRSSTRIDTDNPQQRGIVGATTSTAIGLVPADNTGGAIVSGFRKMPVPEELRTIIDAGSTH